MAITALHCVNDEAVSGGYPSLLRHDGPYKARIIAAFPHADIAVLHAEQKLDNSEEELPAPTQFLSLKERPLWLGTSVGYFTRLRVNGDGRSLFCQAAVAAMNDNEEHPRFMLSSTILQAGHSGSPVFDTQGVLVGVVVQSFQFTVSTQQATDPVHTLPVMSCTAPILKEIRDAIASV